MGVFRSISLKATIESPVAGVFVESGVNAAITLPPANYQTSRRMLYRDNNRLSIPYITENLFGVIQFPDRVALLPLGARLLGKLPLSSL